MPKVYQNIFPFSCVLYQVTILFLWKDCVYSFWQYSFLHTTNIWPLFIKNLKRSLWSDLYSFTLGLNSLLFRGRQLQDAKIFQNVWQNFASNQNHLCGFDLRRAFEIKFICLEVLLRQNCFKRIRFDFFPMSTLSLRIHMCQMHFPPPFWRKKAHF